MDARLSACQKPMRVAVVVVNPVQGGQCGRAASSPREIFFVTNVSCAEAGLGEEVRNHMRSTVAKGVWPRFNGRQHQVTQHQTVHTKIRSKFYITCCAAITEYRTASSAGESSPYNEDSGAAAAAAGRCAWVVEGRVVWCWWSLGWWRSEGLWSALGRCFWYFLGPGSPPDARCVRPREAAAGCCC